MVPKLMMTRDWRGRGQLVVQLHVSTKEARRSGNLQYGTPGRYLFRGFWYGSDARDVGSYGKCVGRVGQPVGKVVGKRLSAYQRRKIN